MKKYFLLFVLFFLSFNLFSLDSKNFVTYPDACVGTKVCAERCLKERTIPRTLASRFVHYKNSFSVGFAAYGNLEDDKLKLIDSYAPTISYERLIFQDSDSFSFAAEANLLVAPYNNDYSLSLNAICYLGEFEGLFVGISPFSNINFGNLFLESPYLNYAIGTIVGFRANIKHISLKSQVTYSVSFYDKQTPFKMVYVLSLGYMW